MSNTGWIQLGDGSVFDFENPRSIRIDTIANALAKLGRYTGHSRSFFSVAQHSHMVSTLVPPQIAAHALLHDSAEVILNDLSTPFKALLNEKTGGFLKDLEHQIERAIYAGFGLDADEYRDEVKRADREALCVEVRDLLPHGERSLELPFGLFCVSHIERIRRCWLPDEAAERFRERWAEVRP